MLMFYVYRAAKGVDRKIGWDKEENEVHSKVCFPKQKDWELLLSFTPEEPPSPTLSDNFLLAPTVLVISLLLLPCS